MNLLKSLAPIAAGIGAGYLLGGGSASSFAASEGTKRLAESFLTASGARDTDGTLERPFSPVASRPRSVKQLTSLSADTTPAQLIPIKNIVASSPRLETAIASLYNAASNPQVRDMFAQYKTDYVTLAQGRRTLTTEQPNKIQVT